MSDEASPPRELFIARLAIGLIQGLALYLLYRASDLNIWPATDPYLFAPLLMVALYVPLLITQAAGGMRLATLLAWTVAATAICAGLGLYDRFRAEPLVIISDTDLLPQFATLFFGFGALFIAQSLIAAGDAERRIVASYDGYFDAAWKLGVQLALATVFVGVFWGVLWLGAELFDLIKLNFLEKLIEHDWFAIPATALATAAAIQLTDVRARLVAGIRNVVLTMLAWLLPLLTLIAVGFLISLFVTGLAPLWQTKEAAAGLLSAAAGLVVLINAAYQNGEHEQPAMLRYSEAVASFALVPLVLLSIYAIALRVGQYGWTVDRITSAACALVAACYAFGYAAAAVFSLRDDVWMETVQRCNVFTAFIVLAVVLALLSPIADPARISVNDQVARLEAGKVSPAQFDFYYLDREGGRYGRAALKRLASKSPNADIRQRAQYQLDVTKTLASTKQGPLKLADNLTVYPKGQTLPKSFLAQDWSKVALQATVPSCLTIAATACDAVLADLDGDGTDEVIVINGAGAYWWGTVMKVGADGYWTPVATLPSPHCAGDLEALHDGTYKLAATPPSPWRLLVVGGHNITVRVPDTDAPPTCTP
jgi:hypothetical protein